MAQTTPNLAVIATLQRKLNATGLNKKDQVLYDFLHSLLTGVDAVSTVASRAAASSSSGGGGSSTINNTTIQQLIFGDGIEGEQGFPGRDGTVETVGPAGATGAQGPTGPATFLEAEVEEPLNLMIPGNPGPQGNTGAAGASGGWVLLDSKVASASASLDFATVFSATYDVYFIDISGLVPTTNSAIPYLRVSTDGATFDAGNNYYWSNAVSQLGTGTTGANGQGATSALKLFTDSGLAAGVSSSFPFDLGIFVRNPLGSTYRKNFDGRGSAVYATGPTSYGFDFWGIYTPTTALTGFQIIMHTSTIAVALVSVYGLQK